MTDAPPEHDDLGLWGRLRRRKVVQWTLAYAAGAWGLAQVVGFFVDAFHWPDAVKQVAAIVLVVGFAVVLTLAWYHGDKGEQSVTRPEVAVLALVLLLGGAALWLRGERNEPSVATAPAGSPTTAAKSGDKPPSIAVLPFENRSRLEDDAFFVDGIHDDILTQLSKVSALKVISRTSVEKFRDTELSTKEIAAQLGVTSILEGGVQRAGDRVRINVQLIDAGTDAHLWAESYDRELTAANIFAIQSEVATAITGALKATLTAGEKARVDAVPTQNLEAWENYQLGRQRLAKRTAESVVEAERFFQKSIELDPQFALGYAGVADALGLQVHYSGVEPAATLARADEFASKALQLDPSLAEAWVAAAEVASVRYDWARADSLFKRALELNPSDATAHMWYGNALEGLGRWDEALVHQQTAVELDPLSAIANVIFAEALMSEARFDEAEVRIRKAIDIDPSMPGPYNVLSWLYSLARNDFVTAVALTEAAIERDPDSHQYVLQLAFLYMNLDDRAEAARLAQSAQRRWPDATDVKVLSGVIRLLEGDAESARRVAREILDESPKDFQALDLLLQASAMTGALASARERWAEAFPEMFGAGAPQVHAGNYPIAIQAAVVLVAAGERERALVLLAEAERHLYKRSRVAYARRMDVDDARIYALRGERERALATLRDAERSGWRQAWWYYRDLDPALESIRSAPEFKAVFTDIQRDMARQRAALAARRKGSAPGSSAER